MRSNSAYAAFKQYPWEFNSLLVTAEGNWISASVSIVNQYNFTHCNYINMSTFVLIICHLYDYVFQAKNIYYIYFSIYLIIEFNDCLILMLQLAIEKLQLNRIYDYIKP